MAVVLGFSTVSYAAFAQDISGIWQQIDDKSGAPKAIIQIRKETNNTYTGKIVKITPRSGYTPRAQCNKCPTPYTNQPILGILIFASFSAVALPMGLAYLLHMTSPDIMAFATRAVTTPIAINIATLLQAPISLVILIVILSGVIGAAFSPLILRHINDERASGLALGLAAHAIGTAQAWQRGSVAGRYAAFGMAVNAVFTAVWLPTFILFLQNS